MSGEDQTNNAVLVQVQIQLGKIEGILSTLVTEHARRIADAEDVSRKLRTDLTAVKDEGAKALADFAEKVQKRWEDTNKDTAQTAANLAGTISAHETTIQDIKNDVSGIQDKQHNGLSRAAIIVSPLVSVGALLWSIISNHH
jgi:histidinol dehydrogenase